MQRRECLETYRLLFQERSIILPRQSGELAYVGSITLVVMFTNYRLQSGSA